MAKRILAIDDMRECKGATVLARTFEDGLRLVMDGSNGQWDELWIDHDLGCFKNGREYTGYDILCSLEAIWPVRRVDKIVILSSNASGRLRMQQVIDQLFTFPHPPRYR